MLYLYSKTVLNFKTKMSVYTETHKYKLYNFDRLTDTHVTHISFENISSQFIHPILEVSHCSDTFPSLFRTFTHMLIQWEILCAWLSLFLSVMPISISFYYSVFHRTRYHDFKTHSSFPIHLNYSIFSPCH